MPKRKAVLGRLVLERATGRPVGRVEELVLDPAGTTVLGVLVRGPGGHGYYDLRELTGYGADVLQVAERLGDLGPRPVRAVAHGGAGTRRRWVRQGLLKKRVVDDRGRDRGVLEDIWFDARSGRVTRWVLSDSVLGDLVAGRKTIPAPAGAVCGPDTIVVAADAFGAPGDGGDGP